MSIKLTDKQHFILSAAAQREDRCLTIPKSLRGSAAQKVSSKLLAAGLVREIRAKPGAPVWRRDEEVETSYSLKLTAAGMKAIVVDEDDDRPATSRPSTTNLNPPAPVNPSATANEIDSAPVLNRSTVSGTAPREGTKMAAVVALLRRDHGATLAEIIAVTDWLPHTVRAALTGLRKRGFVVTLDRSSKERGSTYAIARGQSIAGEAAGVQTIEPHPAPTIRAKNKPSRSSKSEQAALAAIGSAA